MAPKLVGGQEKHGAPPGYHLLAAILLLYPATLLLPAAGVVAWKGRAEPGVRFALCWLIPVFVMFEPPDQAAPLSAARLRRPGLADRRSGDCAPLGKDVRWIGAALALLAGPLFAVIAIVGLSEVRRPGRLTWGRWRPACS
jgi:hypothetical protein